MKRLFLLGLIGLMFTSCVTISGTTNISTPIKIKEVVDCDDWDDFCDDDVKESTINSGVHQSKIVFNSKRSATFSIKTNSDWANAEIQLPRGQEIPRYDGEFTFDSTMIDQEFSLAGVVSTKRTSSETFHTTERCDRTERRTVCRTETDRNGRSRTVCRDEYVTVYGWQNVSYYYNHRKTTIKIGLVVDEARNGEFVGKRNESDKVYTYTGYCR